MTISFDTETEFNSAGRLVVYGRSVSNFDKLPDLIEIQKKSFEWFLKEGLIEELKSFSPIQDYSGRLELYFLPEYKLGNIKYTVEECRIRDTSYAAALRVPVQLVNKITGEIKESEIFMGDLPMMTDRGTFIVNGVERVVVSQIIRSPGVYFKRETDSNNKRIHSATIIPNRGAWLTFETDTNDIVYVKVDKTRKILATTFLRAYGYSNQEIIEYFRKYKDFLQKTLDKDHTQTTEEALIEIHRKLRPGDPPSVDGGKSLLNSRFSDPKRYDLGKVGRYKINKKLKLELPLTSRVLTKEDIIATIDYLMGLSFYDIGSVDDIDHLGNRRVRSVGELIQNQFRVGLARIERTVKERMTIQDIDNLNPQNLVNTKPLIAAIKEFFGSSQLSQFMDQTNPLSEMTNKRVLTALGPGGITSRDRASYQVRDIHPSHNGRICPVETPEGANAGLIGRLTTFGRINEYGFIETPYWKVVNGKKTNQLVYLTADEEDVYRIASGDTAFKKDGSFLNDKINVRFKNEFLTVSPENVDLVGISPVQIVSVGTSLIPFLEHDDANRAAMGANMQRQAVPLIKNERPYIGTGMEEYLARDSRMIIYADEDSEVKYVDSNKIILKGLESGKEKKISLLKFFRTNNDTCINQKSRVLPGQIVKKGEPLIDSASIQDGELSLGKNLLIAFMPWEGYNFEDAILISQRLVYDDVFTSIHIEKHEIEARTTKLGDEEITREIPNLGEDSLKDLDENGIIRIGAEVKPGDILVGKITPKGESEHPPEEKLLRAIFGEKAKDVRDTSLRVPHGQKGKVIDVKVFSRENGDELPPGVNKLVRVYLAQKRKITVGDKISGRHGNKGIIAKILPVEDMPYLPDGTPIDVVLNPLGVPSRMNVGQIYETLLGFAAKILDRHLAVLPFDEMFAEEASLKLLRKYMQKAKEKMPVDWLNEEGRLTLYDGRTGLPFDRKIAVGYHYMIKLVHQVEDKIHARSTGPYSLVTQQPLGGKAQFGGQRLGEMEVWAVEAYGAAYTLQELLTIKSDDVTGRAMSYECIVKGKNLQKPGIPESFRVLIRELQSICLDIQTMKITEDGQEVEVELFEDSVSKKDKLKGNLIKSTIKSGVIE